MPDAQLIKQALAAHRAGRAREALALYDQVLSRDPGAIDALRYGAMAQLQLGDARAAIARLEGALSRAPNDAPSHLLLGNAHESLERSDLAIPCFERAIELAPDDPQAHHNLGVALKSVSRLDDAIAAYRRALDLKPDYAQAHSNLAQALQAAERYDEAIASARAAIALRPDFIEAHRNLGNGLHDAGRLVEAQDAYRRGLALDPSHATMRQALFITLMQSAAHDEALDVCDEGLRRAPGHSVFLGFKGIVLDHLGEHEAARELVDVEQMVWTTRIDVPAGFRDLDDFNASLRRHALETGEMIVETGGDHGRYDKATRGGGYIRDLTDEPKGPIADFENVIEGAVATYLRTSGIDPSHPFLAERPERWRLEIWGTFLGEDGHQTSHHHPAGWLSGVYYVRVPPSVTASDPAHGGWIEFGRPAACFAEPDGLGTRVIRPEEGLMVLFPSFVFHGTIPNPSPDERISFAFDLCPV